MDIEITHMMTTMASDQHNIPKRNDTNSNDNDTGNSKINNDNLF